MSFDRWIALDLHYIDNWSLQMDLRILAMTIPAVLKGRELHDAITENADRLRESHREGSGDRTGVADILRGLDRSNTSPIYFARPRAPGTGGACRGRGLPSAAAGHTIRTAPYRILRSVWHFWKAIAAMRGHITELKPHLVHANTIRSGIAPQSRRSVPASLSMARARHFAQAYVQHRNSQFRSCLAAHSYHCRLSRHRQGVLRSPAIRRESPDDSQRIDLDRFP